MKKIGMLVACCLLFPATLFADDDAPTVHGFFDLNAYYDTRDMSVYTIDLFANLPYRLQYFSFVNYSNAAGTTTNFDLTAYYTEQNVTWFLPRDLPFGVNLQWQSTSLTATDDLLRLALQWKISSTPGFDRLLEKIHMTYGINFHVIQTDFDPSPGWGMQIEHFYRIVLFPTFLDNRVSLAGFADHNLLYGAGRDNNNVWVTEHQLALRVVGDLSMVAEFRRNEFMLTDRTGLGVGLQYAVHF